MPSTPCRQALPAPIADTITTILQGVIDSPDPNRTGRNAALTVQAAGKTGTTDNYGAAWFDGYTPTLAGATWVGDPTGASHPLTNLTLDGTYYQHVYGGDTPAHVWATAMQAATDAGAGTAGQTPTAPPVTPPTPPLPVPATPTAHSAASAAPAGTAPP